MTFKDALLLWRESVKTMEIIDNSLDKDQWYTYTPGKTILFKGSIEFNTETKCMTFMDVVEYRITTMEEGHKLFGHFPDLKLKSKTVKPIPSPAHSQLSVWIRKKLGKPIRFNRVWLLTTDYPARLKANGDKQTFRMFLGSDYTVIIK